MQISFTQVIFMAAVLTVVSATYSSSSEEDYYHVNVLL